MAFFFLLTGGRTYNEETGYSLCRINNHTERRSLCGIIRAHLNLARRRTFVAVLLMRWPHILFKLILVFLVCGTKIAPSRYHDGTHQQRGEGFFKKRTLYFWAVFFLISSVIDSVLLSAQVDFR